ncbi:MAG: hypothetical protein JWM11_2479 [Planctomycetaceae bacterium]|nr:hypothetical protein [Planctomycetaceae bacterium]
MDQRFEGTPKAEIRQEGQKLIRGEVTNDWGSQLIWNVLRNGESVARVSARANDSLDFADKTPGKYEAVLQMFQYEGYEKDKDGKYTKSKFVDVSNKLNWMV